MTRQARADDPVAVKAAQERADLRRKQELEDVKAILSTGAGVRFFRRLMDDGYMFRAVMTGNSWTFFNDGQRNIVLRYLDDVREAAPERIIDLMKKEESNE